MLAPAEHSRSPGGPVSEPQTTIRFLNWHDYTAPSVLERFAQETGVRVVESYVDKNDDYVERITAGEVFDVIMATDWAAAALAKAGLVQPLDMRLLSNWRQVTQPFLQRPSYDPRTDGNKYTSAYMFGTEGFAVRLDKVDAARSTWEMLFDAAGHHMVCMVDGSREVLAPALFLLGSDPNTTDADLISKAADMLIEQRPHVMAYDAKTLTKRIIGGIPLVQCWDGDAAAAVSAGVTQVRYMLPREGYRVWADAPCIPANAPDPEAAHRFLNYLLQPQIAAENADFAGFQPVVPAADPLVKSLVQRSMRPTDTQVSRGTFLEDLGSGNALYEEAYARVRGG